MARKRTKKEAKARIDSIDFFERGLGFSPRLDSLLGQLNVVEEAAKAGAKILIEIDPLNRLADSQGQRAAGLARSITSDEVAVPIAELAEMINNPEIEMNGKGDIVRRTKKATKTGREVIRRSGQFRRDLILPDLKPKRTRKKNGRDKKLSAAFKEANKRLRTKSGKLRKGKTQGDIARLAHRLVKKM